MKQTDAAEVEALADQLVRWEQGHDGANETDHWADRLARALLASDWLAAREAAAEVRGAQAVLAAVEGFTPWTETARDDLLAAARAAAAAAGGGAS